MLLTPPVNFAIFKERMPGRKIPLVNNEVYHILNRGISLQPTFINKRDYDRAFQTIFYYQNQSLPLKYSRFLYLSAERRVKILENLKAQRKFLVEVIAFCLMPNHFHFLLKQTVKNGISMFMSNFTNSYTRYFNTKHERNGPLFQGKFKAKRIQSDEQLLHVSRYIHLNPYTSYVVKNLKELTNYFHSSFPEYIRQPKGGFCGKEIILSQFKDNNLYKKFVLDQADYQRKLETIKHLLLEK